jgi:hypothetical protein
MPSVKSHRRAVEPAEPRSRWTFGFDPFCFGIGLTTAKAWACPAPQARADSTAALFSRCAVSTIHRRDSSVTLGIAVCQSFGQETKANVERKMLSAAARETGVTKIRINLRQRGCSVKSGIDYPRLGQPRRSCSGPKPSLEVRHIRGNDPAGSELVAQPGLGSSDTRRPP